MEWVDSTASKVSSLNMFIQGYRIEKGKYPASIAALLKGSDSEVAKAIDELLNAEVLGANNQYEFYFYTNSLKITATRQAGFLLPAEKIVRTYDTNGDLINTP